MYVLRVTDMVSAGFVAGIFNLLFSVVDILCPSNLWWAGSVALSLICGLWLAKTIKIKMAWFQN